MELERGLLRFKLFLSTPSVRRATIGNISRGGLTKISIHALREEGDDFWKKEGKSVKISIHALREEGDSPTT